jgi:hypothetical protein
MLASTSIPFFSKHPWDFFAFYKDICKYPLGECQGLKFQKRPLVRFEGFTLDYFLLIKKKYVTNWNVKIWYHFHIIVTFKVMCVLIVIQFQVSKYINNFIFFFAIRWASSKTNRKLIQFHHVRCHPMVGRYVNSSIWIDQAKANLDSPTPPKK